jgi:hypothetical protein
MLGAYEKFTANTGIGSVATANVKLDGSGTMTTLLTAASNGTLIKTVTIKAQVAIGSGDIIRLFISPDAGVTNYLLQEILFRPEGGGVSSVFSTANMVVALNFTLKPAYLLRASTDVAKKFSIEIEGLDWAYP